MASLVVVFAVASAFCHGDFIGDDTRRDAQGFSVDQRGKFVFLKSEPWPDQVGFGQANEVLTHFLAAKGNATAQINAQRMESRGYVSLKKHAGIGNHVAGDLYYTLVVEDNGSGFTYWLTDLEYQPYRNDRYGKRVKATAAPIPLETQVSKINEQIWHKQRRYAYEAIDELAGQLSDRLEASAKPRVVDTTM